MCYDSTEIILAKTEPILYLINLQDGEMMSILSRYIIREHVSPFFFSVATIIFIFILNIVFRDLGRLLGKDLPFRIILEFFVYNLAWILALAVPMSVLVSTLIAFGRLSSDFEITALKANGVHIYRLVAPVFILSVILSVLMIRFNDVVLPEFNHRVRNLYSDISRKRPTLTLEPHVIFNEIEHYSMLVRGVDNQKNTIKGVIIHDNSDPRQSKIITAQRGELIFDKETERMNFILYEGEIHEVDNQALEKYRRMNFEKHQISIPVSNMVLRRSRSEYRGDREKDMDMMRQDILKNRSAVEERNERIRKLVSAELETTFPKSVWEKGSETSEDGSMRRGMLPGGRQRIRVLSSQLEGEVKVIKGLKRSVSSLQVEIEKKVAVPFACIVFVLIGAPLGIMMRRGGYAVGAGMSLIFFMIYWAFLIGGEQLADRHYISPVVAMWAPNIIVGTVGIYLVIRAVRESTIIPWDRWLLSLWKRRGNPA
jgi:lipopolysaccharide export system permease protein